MMDRTDPPARHSFPRYELEKVGTLTLTLDGHTYTQPGNGT
jgi:hypothetical protein